MEMTARKDEFSKERAKNPLFLYSKKK